MGRSSSLETLDTLGTARGWEKGERTSGRSGGGSSQEPKTQRPRGGKVCTSDAPASPRGKYLLSLELQLRSSVLQHLGQRNQGPGDPPKASALWLTDLTSKQNHLPLPTSAHGPPPLGRGWPAALVFGTEATSSLLSHLGTPGWGPHPNRGPVLLPYPGALLHCPVPTPRGHSAGDTTSTLQHLCPFQENECQ